MRALPPPLQILASAAELSSTALPPYMATFYRAMMVLVGQVRRTMRWGKMRGGAP